MSSTEFAAVLVVLLAGGRERGEVRLDQPPAGGNVLPLEDHVAVRPRLDVPVHTTPITAVDADRGEVADLTGHLIERAADERSDVRRDAHAAGASSSRR
jgi:hypothetical protein